MGLALRENETMFRCDPYRDLYQDVFTAETATWKAYVGYDDVSGEYSLRVEFKRNQIGFRDREARVAFENFSEAMTRLNRFLTEHPTPRPQCFVDY
jgi:hypothetical protein